MINDTVPYLFKHLTYNYPAKWQSLNVARYFYGNILNIQVDGQLTLMEAYWIHFFLD
jgi:hypothetical protein